MRTGEEMREEKRRIEKRRGEEKGDEREANGLTGQELAARRTVGE